MKLLVTGGAGFIGSNFVRYWLQQHPEDSVINFDALTYAGCLDSLHDVVAAYADRYTFIQGDIRDQAKLDTVFSQERPDIVINFAAESHNSRAIGDPGIFMDTNALGTQRLLEACRLHEIPRFHHISTCEVYGDLDLDSNETFSEDSPYRPRTPYNASKAAADMIVRAYFTTYQLPVTISNCANNYGPYQFPEKVIPVFTLKALANEQLPVYKQSQNKREWIHVLDHCRALELILTKGQIGQTYNVGTGIELSVEQIADTILQHLGKDSSLKHYVDDRPSHDRRYLLNSAKIKRELGWLPQIDITVGMQETIEWYKNNEQWWRPLLKKASINEADWKK